MYLDKIRELKKKTNTTTKYLADKMHRSERTVSRMLSGEASIDINELQAMVSLMGGSLDDIFDGSDFKLPKPEIEALSKEIDALQSENAILKAEIAMLKDKVAGLDAENDRLRLTLAHKEELLALHTYYMNRHKGD